MQFMVEIEIGNERHVHSLEAPDAVVRVRADGKLVTLIVNENGPTLHLPEREKRGHEAS